MNTYLVETNQFIPASERKSENLATLATQLEQEFAFPLVAIKKTGENMWLLTYGWSWEIREQAIVQKIA